jgi:hypothetical protein
MAFDSQTRNRLVRFVADARKLITDEFTEKFQSLYGLSPSGEITPEADLRHLDEEQKATAERLRARLHHLEPDAKDTDRVKPDAIDHLTREQAFTVLNRLSAIRMAEKRGIIIESVGRGYESKGFKVYLQVAGNALGDTYHKYRRYLFCLFDELAVDLGALFDRRSSAGLLFLREPALVQLLQLLNAPDLEPLWAEDETIGWIYQYYNDPAERKKMREQSSAPRNSRELAVRNQFFTPRYVVEFLTDNTLGRIWYEMTKGQTRLKEQCRYLVRQPKEIFLERDEQPPNDESGPENLSQEEILKQPVYIPYRPLKNPRAIRLLDPACGSMHFGLYAFDLFEAIYEEAWDLMPDLREEFEQAAIVPEGIRVSDERALRCDATGEALSVETAVLAVWPYDVPQRDRPGRLFLYSRRSADERRDRLSLIRPLNKINWATLLAEKWVQPQALSGFLEIHREAFEFQALDPVDAHERFQREIPRLIIERNIHGIDIDPRCAQIAGLSLWLRAQRSWQQQRLRAAERPQIQRCNIVCAEPMPGEEAFLNEFIEAQLSGTPEKNLLGQVVRRVFDAMKLAGEAGSLLKIEGEIVRIVAEAKQKWIVGPKLEQGRLFADDDALLTQKELGLDVTGLSDETFWERAEEGIYSALQAYAERAEHGFGYQRRLFAADAARGFAFIDLCRKRYDVVLMNPPFGQGCGASASTIKNSFKRASFDLFACFLERALGFLNASGSLGAISTSAGFYRNQIEEWRASFFLDGSVRVCADLGGHVLDGATVRTAAYVRDVRPNLGKSVFVRCNESRTKADLLFDSLQRLNNGERIGRTFLVDTRRLNDLPGRPLAYWLPANFQQQITKLKRFEACGGDAQFGLSTKDDFRFLRFVWEVPASLVGQANQWCFTSKGGVYSPFYFDIHLLVLHESNFRTLEQAILTKYPYLGPNASWVLHRENNYYHAGITFQRRTNKPFAPRALPAGCLFTDNGPSAFWSAYPLAAFLGLFNSSAVRLLAAVGNGALEAEGGGGANSYEVGIIKNIVVPVLPPQIVNALANHSIRIVRSKQALDMWLPETRVFASSFPKDSSEHVALIEASQREIDLLTQNLDDLVNPLYGFTRTEIDELLSSVAPSEEHEEDEARPLQNSRWLAHDRISRAFGCSFGRWDIRFATGERSTPELPDPFAPLPVCPPGQLQNEQGLPLTKDDVRRLQNAANWHYPLDLPWDGILVDDRGHLLDIEGRINEVLQVVWKERWEAVERDACEILGTDILRNYFHKPAGFFADHLQRYSKSRRQAPIYWPLSTASCTYTLWVYYHRINNQTLHTAMADFLEPKIKSVEREAQQQKDEGKTQKYTESVEFLDELKELRAEIERIIKLPWNPNLNDGVLITASPLWKLFRFGKWQKDLKACWEELEGGKYDWAHLAFAIWPDRVRQKCKTDRSLAIAHDLEELYTGESAKPTKRKTRNKVM